MVKHPAHLNSHREGFGPGITWISKDTDLEFPTFLDFAVIRLRAGEAYTVATHEKEKALVLMSGLVDLRWRKTTDTQSEKATIERRSLFDERPKCFHGDHLTTVFVQARQDAELCLIQAKNSREFVSKLFQTDDVQSELRGAGLAQGATVRDVRLIFDKNNRPESEMVLGEVVNFPGRWSSYPPHHHDQPELYHYRFTEPQGFGHAELGDAVVKVKQFDTVKIMGGWDHAQVSAPGYGMYYLWAVKHLSEKPYLGFQFSDDHTWLLDPKKQGWEPQL
ncbi:MAG: 5-deoxy-glucuronate isomerase [Oligoflexia bacterium]|nr:5-deoxy-glucuronate isomerase [Oligoflexia bacterium]